MLLPWHLHFPVSATHLGKSLLLTPLVSQSRCNNGVRSGNDSADAGGGGEKKVTYRTESGRGMHDANTWSMTSDPSHCNWVPHLALLAKLTVTVLWCRYLYSAFLLMNHVEGLIKFSLTTRRKSLPHGKEACQQVREPSTVAC